MHRQYVSASRTFTDCKIHSPPRNQSMDQIFFFKMQACDQEGRYVSAPRAVTVGKIHSSPRSRPMDHNFLFKKMQGWSEFTFKKHKPAIKRDAISTHHVLSLSVKSILHRIASGSEFPSKKKKWKPASCNHEQTEPSQAPKPPSGVTCSRCIRVVG